MQIKALSGAILKAIADEGTGVAVIATLGVKDHDGDVTMAGAFGKQTVKVVPGHDWGHVPIGKATIEEIGDELVAQFSLFMEIQSAKEWQIAMKKDLDMPPAIQEWSYGFTVTKQSFGDHDGDQVRFLEAMDVHEISPVLMGAGINTRTLALKGKSITLVDHIAGALGEIQGAIDRCKIVKGKRVEDGRDLSPERYLELKNVHSALGELEQIQKELSELITSPAPMGAEEGDRLFAGYQEAIARNRGVIL